MPITKSILVDKSDNSATSPLAQQQPKDPTNRFVEVWSDSGVRGKHATKTLNNQGRRLPSNFYKLMHQISSTISSKDEINWFDPIDRNINNKSKQLRLPAALIIDVRRTRVF
jgi:hypothetical protein